MVQFYGASAGKEWLHGCVSFLLQKSPYAPNQDRTHSAEQNHIDAGRDKRHNHPIKSILFDFRAKYYNLFHAQSRQWFHHNPPEQANQHREHDPDCPVPVSCKKAFQLSWIVDNKSWYSKVIGNPSFMRRSKIISMLNMLIISILIFFMLLKKCNRIIIRDTLKRLGNILLSKSVSRSKIPRACGARSRTPWMSVLT